MPYDMAVYRIEFTIEPFHEGHPGPHVTAPASAVQALGIGVDVGPFGSGCSVEDERVHDVIALISRVALKEGATHVNLDITRVEQTTP